MIEAVENHMPESSSSMRRHRVEAMAARTIAERGVQLVGPPTATPRKI
jgi:stage III sporulation protein SpoIIIAA